MRKHFQNCVPVTAGFTLIDVMITVLILTVALMGTMIAFPNIMKAISVSKARSLALQVAQEQLEVFKNTSYYKLRVTTATNPTPDDRVSGESLSYDIGYYPPETTLTGGIQFEKVCYIEKVAEVGGDFIHVDWAAPDVGMKKITVHVIYKFEGTSGDWKKVTLTGLMENTDRQQLNATLSGVTQTTSSTRIPNAVIYVQENPAFQTISSSTGDYSFSVPAGSWTLVTSATGYFTNILPSVIASSGQVTTTNITLTNQMIANVTGYAFIRDHLVITQVVAGTSPAGFNEYQEWVELYNPTTYSILIASRSVPGGDFDVFFVTVTWIDDENQEPANGNQRSKYLIGNKQLSDSKFKGFRSTSNYWSVNTPTISVPSHGFFLISNVSTISIQGATRIADAYYGCYGCGGEQYNGAQIDDSVTHSNPNSGGIRVTGSQGYNFNGRSDWHDGVGWWESSDDASKPTLAYEYSWYALGAPAVGDVLHRNTPSGFISMPYHRLTTPGLANCYDSDDSRQDSLGGNWQASDIVSALASSTNCLLNADSTMPPDTGRPAVGAVVSCSDGLSDTVFAQSHGSFTITNVTTGAWIVAMVSATTNNTFYQEIYTTVTVATPYHGVPNNISAPSWSNSLNFSSLTLTTSNGMIAGRVTGIYGTGIKDIYIDASQTVKTNAQGYYRLSVSSGEYNVGCNKVNINYAYTQTSSAAVIVQTGQITDGVDFSLVSGGSFEGFVTSNGVDPLPGYTLSLQKDGAEYKTAVSGTDGRFLMTNVATVPITAPYTMYCITDSGESVSPEDGIVSTPTAGATIDVGDFTITAGFSTFSGKAYEGGSVIETGVIVVASTQPITTISSGPVVNSNLTGGTTPYFFAASGADGSYQLKVLGGTRYYLYGWYNSPTSGLVRKSSEPTVPITIGQTKTINLSW